MIIVLEVDVPHVEIGTKDIARGVNRRQHRMILIVVAVLAVAADQLQIRYASQVVSNASKILFEVLVVDRIGLRHSNNDAVENILLADKAELHAFASGQVYQGLIVGVPQLIPRLHEIFESERGVGWIRHHGWTPILEVLDAADFDLGGVDVDPVVVEHVFLVDDEADREEIPVAKLLRRFHDASGRCGVHGRDQLPYRHGRNEVIAGTLTSPPSASTAVMATTLSSERCSLGYSMAEMNRNATPLRGSRRPAPTSFRARGADNETVE